MRPALFAERGWYPATAEALGAFMDTACPTRPDARAATLVISPHAGYRYSGAVAGAAYAQVRVPDVVVVLGIGHRATPRAIVVGLDGDWSTPLGPVPVDASLARAVEGCSDLLVPDQGEQAEEHSLELQVPFLRRRNPDVRIVPVQLRDLSSADCGRLGEALAAVVAAWKEPVLLVASTDLHHQQAAPGLQPSAVVPTKDQVAIDRIADFDPEGLYVDVRSQGVTMCGLLPTATALHAARALGATRVDPVRHATSYDVSGSDAYVVGYLSAIAR